MKYDLTKTEQQFIQATWQRVQAKLAITSQRIGATEPYIATNHRYQDFGEQHPTWWTNAFWCGTLWQLAAATQQTSYQQLARQIERRLDDALVRIDELDHDVGFMWLNAAVTDYRLTGDVRARKRGLKAALLLAGRYNPAGHYLVAWNGAEQQGQVIVDCFMNLGLLYWATQETGNQRFAQIANAHAQTATRALLRADGSSNHIAVFDPVTGAFKGNLGGQGYGQGSAWSRGQAWALYGLTLVYKNNHQTAYLQKAKAAAQFFIANVAATGNVSLIDFRAPATPIYYDTTATAIAICGLLELVKYLPMAERPLYQGAAYRMLVALTERFCDFDTAHDELVTKGSAKYHRASDREVPIIYGDTFYVEALLRFLNLDLTIY
ncbi:glycoside hydrolase family 88 protein [Lactiplantibacillus modestisalitolerans]|uniref:Glycoside hydrolase family 88 protein n=1 Tax=Lactiplantibacillus modestisalitolerans TaxID=1457219 RepID=A0ABV5WSX5_9LACO|nr:glycoside hydrolase family 88 protein [Lactiplantibacillus modestisalitolerans]